MNDNKDDHKNTKLENKSFSKSVSTKQIQNQINYTPKTRAYNKIITQMQMEVDFICKHNGSTDSSILSSQGSTQMDTIHQIDLTFPLTLNNQQRKPRIVTRRFRPQHE
ncbi:Hypothetical_protein [Hexamita inflata]|uniref:Hypothetical_protein n=1 Tax=Hexamita inflata TaxID=28002 RepID=A0AA86P315_9EUKA|nr:Hypothetical protein HINF_LOCUS18298 [Hexamita inflata]